MGKFELMALPYANDALEPVISKQTLEFHHGKHLVAYVNNYTDYPTLLAKRASDHSLNLSPTLLRPSGNKRQSRAVKRLN